MPRKSGYHKEGIGAFKDHRTGRYYAAHCDDNGWAEDENPRLEVFFRWSDSMAWVDAEARKERARMQTRREWGRRLSERYAAECRANKGKWPEIRVMRWNCGKSGTILQGTVDNTAQSVES